MTEQLAVVTGAARAMGAAVARRLAVDGWSLALIDLCAPQPPLAYPMPSPADLDTVARDCRTTGAPVVDTLVADVGDGALPHLAVIRCIGIPGTTPRASGVVSISLRTLST